MSTIIVPGMERKGMNKAAFGNQLTCPSMVTGLSGTPETCGASSWRFVEKIGAYRIRYKCRACNRTIIYDFSANMSHPYEAYGKSKWRRIVEQFHNKKGSASL